MGRFARQKGKRGERECTELLQRTVCEAYAAKGLQAPLLQRNTLQSDVGGCDVVGIDFLAIEVKRCETLQLSQWWAQCQAQAACHQLPVLFYRQNKGSWRVRTQVALPWLCPHPPTVVTADFDIEGFLRWLRSVLDYRLSVKQ